VLSPQRWRQVKEAFQRVLDERGAARADALAAACGDDADLRAEVERLLSAHAAAEAEDFIEAPAPVDPDLTLAAASPTDVSDTRAAAGRDEGFDEQAWIGRKLGPYRLQAFLGRGGMGTVFRAEREDAAGRRAVALKVVTRWDESGWVRERFEAERRILAALDHPHIARFLDAGTTLDGRPYLVMDLVEGLPLGEYVRAAGLDLRARLGLFRQVCAAVQYLHQNLVVHRDLKPGNVLVTPDGTAKLLDFGIAKLLEPGPGGAALTVTLLRALTPDYASPEQVRGDAVTTASDVYALGAMLYELLCGRRPHRLSTYSPEEVLRAVCQETPERPSAVAARDEADGARPRRARPGRLRRQLEGDLDVIVMTALRKEPERRYRSAEQLSEDVRRHLAGVPVLARPDTFGYRLSKFVHRHRAASVGAVLLLASIVAGVGLTAWQAHQARLERARAERRYAQVRELARAVLFDVDDALRALPGSSRARALIAARSRAWLDGLRPEAAGDPTLARELARGYVKVEQVERELASAGAPGAR
jgi:serine/threonine protein kinase